MRGVVRSALQPGPYGAPVAPIFGAAVVARRWLYDHGLLVSARTNAFCISVGGLEAGGSGKTPVTGLLLSAFRDANRRVGLLTRGYGRGTAALTLRRPGEPAEPALIGDEPAMLVQSGLDLPVAACGRRIVGARALIATGCDTLLLDDGFQHRALARDLDIVVLRGEAPFGRRGHMLPWGTLREPPSSLRRAQVVWLHYREHADLGAPAWLPLLAPKATLVVSEQRPTPARDITGAPVKIAGATVVAAAGIARPSDFGMSLARLGAEVSELLPLADHHRYTPADVVALGRRVEQQRAEALVVTPKDAVKLRALWRGPPLWVVGTSVVPLAGYDELASRLNLPSAMLVRAFP